MHPRRKTEMTKTTPIKTPAKKAAPRKARPVLASPVEAVPAAAGTTKTDAVISLLRRPQGASIEEIMAATGWQRHSVRGALAGAVKKRLGSAVKAELADGIRRYRAPETAA
jgi:hypothetical protein